MQLVSTPAPRTPLNLEVSFRKSYARTDMSGTLKNLSLSGAFLEYMDTDLNIEEKINLTLIVGNRVRKVAAQIIWKNSTGAGVKFLPTNNRDIQIVDDLLYFVESKRVGHRGILDGILQKVS